MDTATSGMTPDLIGTEHSTEVACAQQTENRETRFKLSDAITRAVHRKAEQISLNSKVLKEGDILVLRKSEEVLMS